MSTIYVVPLRNDLPSYKFQITLSNIVYSLALRFNGRMNRWIMDINDAQGNQILSGIPLLINTNLTAQYVTLPLPVGAFICVDSTGGDNQPTLYTFGLQNLMYYVDPET